MHTVCVFFLICSKYTDCS